MRFGIGALFEQKRWNWTLVVVTTRLTRLPLTTDAPTRMQASQWKRARGRTTAAVFRPCSFHFILDRNHTTRNELLFVYVWRGDDQVTFGFCAFGLMRACRFAPLDEELDSSCASPSAACPFLRTVGGDELNVAVALSKLGLKAKWASVLPTGFVTACFVVHPLATVTTCVQ